MTSSKRILIGEITTAHGIKGFVKVRSFVDDQTLLEGNGVFTSETSATTILLKLKNSLKGDWVAEVKGITDRNAAEALRGTKLFIDRDRLPDDEDGDGFYVEDLKGLRVVNRDGKEIGTIAGVENFGASDLIDIKPTSGDAFYLPFTEEAVLEVNLEAGTVVVELPEIL